MSLTRYKAKRDFSRTNEPRGVRSTRRGTGERFLFVIQKHAARRLHYDFRLELDGVLKSWALPKGVPTVQGEKRLAVQVEDHPVDYANFEGTIPAGNYGAGTVMLWDAGICEALEGRPTEALRKGKLLFHLEGRKLKGEWTLIRMRPKEDRDDNAWLIVKTGKNARAISARADDRSVVSGRTMKQITAEADRTWQSNRNQSSSRRVLRGADRAAANKRRAHRR
jgi:bifunctional non-homologous end joining protein LigD